MCGENFQPLAPSHLYCSETCAGEASQDKYYRRNYGISRAEWLSLHKKQGNKCYICEGDGFLMREDHAAKLMVDHCHDTGKVRGLLCHNCNRALGLFKDSTKAIRRALEYLEGATTIP